jgi:D-alanyl-D-alanine carboxypeptidase/D-alanyl-D-alanine-endopeptidase (penicillin-binding protein 4)
LRARTTVVVAPLLAFTSACGRIRAANAPTAPRGAVAELRAAIDSMADAPEFANAHWGILIVDPESGDTLYSRNAGKLFMPASNMKILTSATILDHVGPDFRFRTTVAARGGVSEGTVMGDLLVIGRGDPSVSDHMLKDAMIPLRAIADSLAARGVRRVAGRLVADGNAFPDDVFGFGWSYDDFDFSYSAPIDELLFNEGFSVLTVRAGASVGDLVAAETRPAKTFPRLRVTATTSPPRPPGDSTRGRGRALRVRKDSTTWETIVEGQIALGDSATIEITHHDPNTAYLAALREALADRGITVDGAGTDTLARADTLVTLLSPPLREILPALMKPSQNQIAEMLYKAAGLEETGIGRADSARAVVQRQLAKWGVAAPEVVVRDGSGLSRYDYVSPRSLVRVLDAMRRSPHFTVYYDAMPIGGVDGTIRSRMRGTAAEGNVHAKTGSVAMARSLSGYVTTADRRLLIFSFLCNNWTVPVRSVERVQDAITARLASMRLR